MQIEAIERQTTADLVVERIARVIKDQNLSAGERLPGEHELVEQLKVSRPVLREALARLQSMGLVDIQRGRGTFVGNRTSLANCVRLPAGQSVGHEPFEQWFLGERYLWIYIEDNEQRALADAGSSSASRPDQNYSKADSLSFQSRCTISLWAFRVS